MAFTPEPALIESAGKINTESFGRRVRVHSVAKELGITSKEFIAVLGEFGITGKVPSSTLSNEEATDVVSRLAGGGGLTPVSYTHLTLPTILRSCRSRWSPYH